eukprot:g2490.t1
MTLNQPHVDEHLRDEYANPWGFIRMGRILEDMDALAGNIASRHSDRPGLSPLLNVTASVNDILIKHRCSLHSDMKLSGKVVWTGRSSQLIEVTACSSWTQEPWLTASFLYVSRSMDGKAAVIPQLMIESDEEKQRFDVEQKKQDRAKEARREATSSTKALLNFPTDEAAEKARSLLRQARAHLELPALAPTDSMLMILTRQYNNFICQRQSRNTRGRIFGGFLMRRGFEIGFTTAYLVAGTQPLLLEVDEIVFHQPVNIGDFLRLEAHVLWIEPAKPGSDPGHRPGSNHSYSGPRMHVEVVAKIMKPETLTFVESNTFHFVFGMLPMQAEEGHVSHQVCPPDVLKLEEGQAKKLKWVWPRLRQILPATQGEASKIVKYQLRYTPPPQH